MPDLSTDELTADGEYGFCEVCDERLHWEQLSTNAGAGVYCDTHLPDEDSADHLHDSAVDRDAGEGF